MQPWQDMMQKQATADGQTYNATNKCAGQHHQMEMRVNNKRASLEN